MSIVTPIKSAMLLPQTHYDAIAHIQRLGIIISLQRRYAVNVEYCGQVYQLQVVVMRRGELNKGNYKPDSIKRVDFYPMGKAADQLRELQSIIRELDALLIPPTGDAA